MSVLAFGLSTGEILMSIPSIGLAVNWLAEAKFKTKRSRIKELKYAPLVFLGFFLLLVVWLFFAENKSEAIKDLVLKLPLLSFPIVIGSLPLLKKKEWQIIIASFLIGLVVSVLAGFKVYYFESFTDFRELSVFISHIRLSLLLGLGVLLLLMGIFVLNTPKKYLLLLPLGLFIYFIRILESGTGYISLVLAIVLFVLFWSRSFNTKTPSRIVALFILFLILVSAGFIYNSYINVTTVKDDPYNDIEKLELKTNRGNMYLHNTEIKTLENGYYLWHYTCSKELKEAWELRSTIAMDSVDKKGQPIVGTLFRYLTSKGERKDYEGVMSLTIAEVNKIENGTTSAAIEKIGLSARIEETLFEIISFKSHKNPNGLSMIQRMYYLDAGWHLFREHLLLGVSKGDEWDSYQTYYATTNSKLTEDHRLRAHNQFLSLFVCFGIVGGTLILSFIFYPFLVLKKHYLSIVFICFAVLSFVTDDVFDTQAGVTFFAFFYCLFLFQTIPDFYQKDSVTATS